jgi:hypothetical protein
MMTSTPIPAITLPDTTFLSDGDYFQSFLSDPLIFIENDESSLSRKIRLFDRGLSPSVLQQLMCGICSRHTFLETPWSHHFKR